MSILLKNEHIIIDDDDEYDFERTPVTKSSKDQLSKEILNPDLHCALCLRQHTSNGKFYEYQNEDCSTFCEYVKDMLGFELNLKHLFICMPCCKMVEMVDSFRECCLKARGWLNQVGVGLSCADQWFSEETFQAIERIDEAIRIHSEQLEPAGNGIPPEGYLGGENHEDDVISIKSDNANEISEIMSNESQFFPYGIALESDIIGELFYMDSSDLTDMDSPGYEPVINSSGINQEQVKAKHNDAPCKCMICGAILSSKTNLKEHLFIHGEATQQCKFCAKKFKQRTNLLRHHRTKHCEIPARNLYPPPELNF